ncbi:histidine phosphatase family protein [Sphingomonas aerophila]|uniref:Putative phosphoglycerate mutase n=1 Tax=Sphingomonas aerophila TaxID=1344948 RepID=A0A7W9BCU9_9SPHN|nr:putative phosphoglycerate mutase [Sphingomonas aerophila]
MAATLLLIRHAAHIHFNRQLSGRMPGVPLSGEGREQAAALGHRLADAGVQHLWTSPLDRTVATAEAIATHCGLPEPRVVYDLVEIDMGDWTGRAFGTFGDDPDWRAWNEQRATARIPGGESMAEAQSRIVSIMERALREHDGETVAIVSHSDMIKAAICHALGLSLDGMSRFDIEPASVSRIVIGDWGSKVMTLNEGVY